MLPPYFIYLSLDISQRVLSYSDNVTVVTGNAYFIQRSTPRRIQYPPNILLHHPRTLYASFGYLLFLFTVFIFILTSLTHLSIKSSDLYSISQHQNNCFSFIYIFSLTWKLINDMFSFSYIMKT